MNQAMRQVLVVVPEPEFSERIKHVLHDSLVFTATDHDKASLILEHQPSIRLVLLDPAVGEGRLLRTLATRWPGLAAVALVKPGELERYRKDLDALRPFRVLSAPPPDEVLAATVSSVLGQQAPQGVEPAGPEPHRGGKPASHEKTEALELRSEWMRVAAHDIRSPLSIINGYATFLLQHEPGLSEQGRNVVGRIRTTGERLLQMLNSILTMASLEEGRMALEYVPTRAGDMLAAVTESLQAAADGHGVSLTVAAPCPDPLLLVDATKVEQVLQNLVSNAIKFSPPGSAVRVSAEVTEGGLRFSVADQGCGLSPEQARHAFDKFSRFPAAGQEGTGLGLAIAKALVLLHDGEIWVESEPGHGAVFSFTVAAQTGADCAGRT